jgi:hypothetical protein
LAATTHRPPGGPHDEVVAIQVPIQWRLNLQLQRHRAL